MKSKQREKTSERPFLYRNFRIIKRGRAENLEQAMAIIDDMM